MTFSQLIRIHQKDIATEARRKARAHPRRQGPARAPVYADWACL